MAGRLVRPGDGLRLGLHHGPDSSLDESRRRLLLGSAGFLAAGAIPSLARAADPRPPYILETKLENGIHTWNGRLTSPLADRMRHVVQNAFNSPAARAVGAAAPLLRMAGRFMGPVGLALTAVDILTTIQGRMAETETWARRERANGSNSTDISTRHLFDLNRTGPRLSVWDDVNAPWRPYTPLDQQPCLQWATDPETGEETYCQIREPLPPRYNNPITYQFITQPILGYEVTTVADGMGGTRLERTPYTWMMGTYERDTNFSHSRPSPVIHPAWMMNLSFYKQQTYEKPITPFILNGRLQTLYRVVDVWKAMYHPVSTSSWEDTRPQIESIANSLVNGEDVSRFMNNLASSSGDPQLMQGIMQRPFYASDFAPTTFGDWMQEIPTTVPIIIGNPDPASNPGNGSVPGTGSGPIEWGTFTPPAFELAPLEVPEIPSVQELFDQITNPLSAILPQQSSEAVACPAVPWFMGQEVTAHCSAVEMAQPLMRDLSRLGAQVAAFFIALKE